MAQLPRHIKVGAFRYTVLTEASDLRLVEQEERRGVCGAVNHLKLAMVIDVSLPVGQQRDTLWHEIKHCVTYLAAWAGGARLAEEEAIARTCSLELMVLRDNPLVAAFLLGDDDAGQEELHQAHGAEEVPVQAQADGAGCVRQWSSEGGSGADASGQAEKELSRG